MKRNDLIKHLRDKGCIFIREGAKHSVFFYPTAGRSSTVPRHSEINNYLAEKICKDLGIKSFKKRR